MPEPSVVHDPQVLRAIAHPVRNRILNELDAQGSMRAADVARELAIPANQASFHLRQLAKYGLVVEDAAAARDKRDRVWKVAHEGGLTVNIEDVEQAPGGAAASRVFRGNFVSWGQTVVAAAYEQAHDDGEHRSVSATPLRLTTDEARSLTSELREVTERWLDRTRSTSDAGRITYLYYGIVLPHPDPPRAADR